MFPCGLSVSNEISFLPFIFHVTIYNETLLNFWSLLSYLATSGSLFIIYHHRSFSFFAMDKSYCRDRQWLKVQKISDYGAPIYKQHIHHTLLPHTHIPHTQGSRTSWKRGQKDWKSQKTRRNIEKTSSNEYSTAVVDCTRPASFVSVNIPSQIDKGHSRLHFYCRNYRQEMAREGRSVRFPLGTQPLQVAHPYAPHQFADFPCWWIVTCKLK